MEELKRKRRIRVWDSFKNNMVYHDVSMFASFDDKGTINVYAGLSINYAMDYLGKDDKDGCPLFEGDLATCKEGGDYVWEIFYDVDSCSYKLRRTDNERTIYLNFTTASELKVRGTVFEHKSLINSIISTDGR